MADYKVETMRSYKIINTYNDDKGDTVKNETNTDYAGMRDDLTGWKIVVGLTETDGVTVDKDTLVEIKPGETATFESGKGAGRNIILMERQENRSTYEPRFDTIAINA